MYVLHNWSNSSRLCFAYCVVSAVLFTPALYCGMLVKDSIFCTCIFALVLAIMSIVHSGSRMDYVVAVLSGIGASVFRYGGVVPVVIVCVALLIYLLWKKRAVVGAIILIAGVLVGYLGVNVVIAKEVLHVEDNPSYITFTMPMYMIGAVSNQVADLSEEDIEIIEQVMPLEQWRQIASENKYWADNIARQTGAVGDNILKVNNPEVAWDLVFLNVKWLVIYPKEYLTSILDITSIVWQIAQPTDGYVWAPLQGGQSITRAAIVRFSKMLHTLFRDVFLISHSRILF